MTLPISLGGVEQTVHTGSIVLCFSRWLYMHFFLDETTESVIALHQAFFHELNGVPEIITYDNMTTVGCNNGSEGVWINPRFKAFAEEYGFNVVILPPGAKDRHGAVERPFHYIEHNFLAAREFNDLLDLNRRGDLWRANVANVRIHGTLRERPEDRLTRERPFLKPLPHILAHTYCKEVKRLIHRDFCVRIDTNLYSATPNLEGKWADVRLYKDHLEIWVDGKMDCRHTYSDKQRDKQVLPEHENAYKDMTHQSKLLETAFMRIGDAARSYYEGLKREKKTQAGYHLQGILKMADRHGSDVVAGALSYAYQNSNLARCFRCAKNFNTIDLVLITKKLSFVETIKFLNQYLPSQKKNNSKKEDDPTTDLSSTADTRVTPHDIEHYQKKMKICDSPDTYVTGEKQKRVGSFCEISPLHRGNGLVAVSEVIRKLALPSSSPITDPSSLPVPCPSRQTGNQKQSPLTSSLPQHGNTTYQHIKLMKRIAHLEKRMEDLSRKLEHILPPTKVQKGS